MTEMLMEHCILEEKAADRFLMGMKEMLWKYSLCRNVWMEIALKVVSVMLVQVVSNAQAFSSDINRAYNLCLLIVMGITLATAVLIWIMKPYAQPQVNQLQVCGFVSLAVAALGFVKHNIWLSRMALLLPFLVTGSQALWWPDSPASLASRLWRQLEPGLADLKKGVTQEVAASSFYIASRSECVEIQSLALALRRSPAEPWLPAIGGVPGHHKDRNGDPRHGLMEIMVIARPTVRGKVTFLHKEVLQQWVPVGAQVEVAALSRLGEFHVDDGSGPWLRDRILITASETEDLAMTAEAVEGGIQHLLSGTGLTPDSRVEPPPADEWDLARSGLLHRDVGASKL
ncbi:unnamed protein product [Symbiodinium pilosum]|uniref:Uncharacterized protein n=1 Tax=Symbiodinium pilosum TaxID=2952 RepID=A0A812REW1_SYMPI|nr:unnamed protein product [Symbiodinium pilosum]